MERDTHDAAFLRQIAVSATELIPIETSNRVVVDTQRIYMAGHSNGCILSIATAMLHSDMVAAVCCTAGVATVPLVEGYIPTPMWTIRGLMDDVIPVDGAGYFPNVGFLLPTTLGSFEHLMEANNCSGEVETTEVRVPEMDLPETQAIMTTRTATGCTGDAPITLVTINTAGHTVVNNEVEEWPPDAATTTLDVTSEMWNFCSRFTKETPPDFSGAGGIASEAPATAATTAPTTSVPATATLKTASRVSLTSGWN